MHSPRQWYLVGLAALGWACAAPESAKAAMILTSRTSDYGITFSDNSFSGTNVNYKITENFSGNNGDFVGYTFSLKSLAQNEFVTSTGGVSITNLILGVPTTTYTVNMTNPPGTGSVMDGYSVKPGANFTQSWVVQGVANGLNTLEYQGGRL